MAHKTSQSGIEIATPSTEVEPTQELGESKEEQQRKIDIQKEVDFTQKQIQFYQDKLTSLQRMAQEVGITTDEPGEDQFEALNRQETEDQDNMQHQQTLDVANQMMQQNQQNQNVLTSLQQQQTANKTAAWVHPERANAKIAIQNIEILCDVAATPRQQASGLQAYNSLPVNRGLWFPLSNRRSASFHMGAVQFPIDILFIDGPKVAKIVANIQPKQMGSWSAICTDVLEVNAGWCAANGVSVGDEIITPLTGKTARSELEKIINTSYSAPQDARITSTKSYDPLRTLTEASNGVDDGLKEELMQMFPHLRTAQENYKVKPDTHREQPGEIDHRDPTSRWEHATLPDETSPFGDGDGADIDPFAGTTNMPDGTDGGTGGVSPQHFQYTRGFDPALDQKTPGDGIQHPKDPKFDGLKDPIRPNAQLVTVTSPSPDTELAGVDTTKLARGSIELFNRYTPEWQDYEQTPGSDYGYEKMAVITDRLISEWIDSLGFDEVNEAQLRKTMFTDEYKRLLGDTLTTVGQITNYEMFDSDLLIYQ